MLRFYPLLVKKGGTFNHILSAGSNTVPSAIIKEYAILFGQTHLKGISFADPKSTLKVQLIDDRPFISERYRGVPARKEHILKLMKEMPQTIANWRRDTKLAKAAAKPKYPY